MTSSAEKNRTSKKLYLNPIKTGRIIKLQDPYLEAEVQVMNTRKNIEATFTYVPIFSKEDASALANKKDYPMHYCVDLFKQINHAYCDIIAQFFFDSSDPFELPSGTILSRVKRRIINGADTVLNLYETNKVRNDLWEFAVPFLMGRGEPLGNEVFTAAKLEYNRLIDQPDIAMSDQDPQTDPMADGGTLPPFGNEILIRNSKRLLVVQALQNHCRGDHKNLLLLIYGNPIKEKVVFQCNTTALIVFFWKLHFSGLIANAKIKTAEWICKNFTIYDQKSDTKKEMKLSTVRRILCSQKWVADNRMSMRMHIDMEELVEPS